MLSLSYIKCAVMVSLPSVVTCQHLIFLSSFGDFLHTVLQWAQSHNNSTSKTSNLHIWSLSTTQCTDKNKAIGDNNWISTYKYLCSKFTRYHLLVIRSHLLTYTAIIHLYLEEWGVKTYWTERNASCKSSIMVINITWKLTLIQSFVAATVTQHVSDQFVYIVLLVFISIIWYFITFHSFHTYSWIIFGQAFCTYHYLVACYIGHYWSIW